METNPNKARSEDLLRRLSAHHDDELAPEEAREMAEALATDDELRRADEELKALDEMLELWPAPPLADVRSVVIARARQELGRAAGRRVSIWRWSTLAWAATWMLGGALTGLTVWTTVDHHIDEQAAAENISQDMTLSMIMTEDWTPPITIEEEAQQ